MDMTYINRYCEVNGLPLPEVNPTRFNVAAMCFPLGWGWWYNQDLKDIGERTLCHELAHLIVRKTDRGDSMTHGPKFRAKELEIENFCRDERRKDLRNNREMNNA